MGAKDVSNCGPTASVVLENVHLHKVNDMGKRRPTEKTILAEIAKMAFSPPEAEGGLKASEKMKALELLCKCLGIGDKEEEAGDDGFRLEVRIREGDHEKP